MRDSFFPAAVRAVSSVLVLSALTLSSVQAAGLGKLTVLSSLGQPLRAEIELTAISKEDTGAIVAKLAPIEAFRKANISFNPALSSLNFSVERRGQRQVIRVTSSQAMNEPFVDMLLELRSSSGPLVREYTFLLDPAELRSASAQVVAPVVVPALVTAVAQMPKAKQVDKVAVSAQPKSEAKSERPAIPEPKPAKPVVEEKVFKGAAEHRVKKGENLTEIARKSKPEELSLEQMLVAIYRANPDAFMGSNMNRLKVGKVLTIPETEVADGVGKSEARKIVIAHTSDFASYRNRLASAAKEGVAQKAAAAGQVGGGSISAKVAEQPTAATEAKDKLKVAKADLAKAEKDKASGATSAEDKLAKDKAAAEAGSRIKELEKNIADLQGVLQLKNKELASQQKQAEKPVASTPPATAAKPPVAASASVPAAQAPVSASMPLAASVPAPASVPPAPKKKVLPPPLPPKPEPGFFDELLDNPMMLGGLGVVGLLLSYIFIRRRKKQSENQSSQPAADMREADKDAPNSLFGSAGGQSVDTHNSIFNSNFTPSASLLDANEVDPVAEADVYIAYGREAQAIEILREALRHHPERNALRVKLLEVYAAKRDVHAFDLLASELYSLTKGEGDEWVYVAGLGAAIDPNNPLYAGGDLSAELLARPTSLPASVTRPSEDLDPDVRLAASRPADEQILEPTGMEIPPEQLAHPDLPLDLEPVAAKLVAMEQAATDDHGALEFGQPDADKVEAIVAEPLQEQTDDGMLEFDLGAQDEIKPVAVDEAKTHEVDAGLDFVMSAQEQSVQPAAEPEAAPEATKMQQEQPDALEFDLGGLDFDNEKPSEIGLPAVEVAELGLDALDHLIEFNPSLEVKTVVAEPAVPDVPSAEKAKDEPLVPDFDSFIPLDDMPQQDKTDLPKLDSSKAAPLSFDFGSINLDLEHVAAKEEAAPVRPVAAHQSRGSIEMDTKIDLADAYLGIGDKEGARELLEEVVQEGVGEQVERAKAMLARIS